MSSALTQNDQTRPLLLGYIRADASMNESDLTQTASDLAAFADDEGYTLASILVERVDQSSIAFEHMVQQMSDTGARALVMPGPILLACAPCRRPTNRRSGRAEPRESASAPSLHQLGLTCWETRR
ncbi:hypothetical protein [Nocardioides speluncae]|uniref:hypothetical protein n=1 Tax=Nocardioides speluncae TaxID=2670337 RepID=UPI000D6869ED|nr:hypothetical protein [Nocardioides speluncae]